MSSLTHVKLATGMADLNVTQTTGIYNNLIENSTGLTVGPSTRTAEDRQSRRDLISSISCCSRYAGRMTDEEENDNRTYKKEMGIELINVLLICILRRFHADEPFLFADQIQKVW